MNEFYYTAIPTQWTPKSAYQISETEYLIPAGRVSYNDYPTHGSTMNFDNIFFVSRAKSELDHMEKLRNWIIFHAFIFNDIHPCQFFEDGLLEQHNSIDALEKIFPITSETNAYFVDYENISTQTYWLYKGKIPRISYKDYYSKYLLLSSQDQSLIINYLLHLNRNENYYLQYDLFSVYREYWQATKNVVLLEQIIGHAPDCSNKEDISCAVCMKDKIPYSHRIMSENEWCKKYLVGVTKDDDTVETYQKIIKSAFKIIRHPTAHSAISPTAKRIQQKTRLEIYDIDKTLEEFNHDRVALMNFGRIIVEIVRYLLLNKLFKLEVFPIPETLKSFNIGSS